MPVGLGSVANPCIYGSRCLSALDANRSEVASTLVYLTFLFILRRYLAVPITPHFLVQEQTDEESSVPLGFSNGNRHFRLAWYWRVAYKTHG